MTKKIDIEELKSRISYNELYDLYITQNKPAKIICNIYNISTRTFLFLIKKYNIVKRFSSKEIDNILTKEILEKEYLENKLSAKAIGKKYRVNEETVLNRLNKYNIEKLNVTRKDKHKKIKENLYDQYIVQNKSINLIAKENQVDTRYISRWLKELKIFKSKSKIKDSQKLTLNINYTKSELTELYKKRAEYQTLDLENRFKKAINEITYDDFYKYYIKENHTRKEVLKYYNISNKLFRKLCTYFNIEKYEYLKNKAPSKEELYQLYIIQQKSIKEIAKETKCSHTVIAFLISKYKINIDSKTRVNKIWATKKIKGTTNTSKLEDEMYNQLLIKFLQTKRNHLTDVYPFRCDFYIPELDLYIEYQGDPSHNKEPYDPSNPSHQKILETWQQKAYEIEKQTGKQSRYFAFIDTWTRRDPLKREVAKKNNLNWLEFFTMNEFMQWYDSLE